MNRIAHLICAVFMAAGFLSMGAAPLKAAEYIGSVSPGDVLKMLQDNGYEDAHVADRDFEDLPILNFTLADSTAFVFFYDCGKTGKNCETLQIRVASQQDIAPSYKQLNDFNADERFSQAYVDFDGEVVIEQWVTLEGGISDVNFINTVATFGLTVDKFEDLAGWKS